MRVLFVSSGNDKFGISPLVKNQGESLTRAGLDIDYYTIKGKGIKGYIKNIPTLKRFIKAVDCDLVHSHFFLSSIVASFAKKKPLIVSLMGSDSYGGIIWKYGIKLFNFFFWDAVIVKSIKMKDRLKLRNAIVIPNGVNLNKFSLQPKTVAKANVSFNDKKHILFVADPKKEVKNFNLAKRAFEKLNSDEVELTIVNDVEHDMIPQYLNAADVLLLTSKWEGSPNVIKEAMASNCPIVATDVGDVKKVFGDTEGCYITTFSIDDVAYKIKLALQFNNKTQGRKRIIDLKLDENSVAQEIIKIYKTLLNIEL